MAELSVFSRNWINLKLGQTAQLATMAINDTAATIDAGAPEHGSTRRAILRAGAAWLLTATALAACNPLASAWAFKRFYKWSAKLNIDGLEYDFANGGVIVGTHGSRLGGGYVFDFPMPSAKALRSGEVALVQPPSIVEAFSNAALRDVGFDKVRIAEYSGDAIPSVFFLRDAKQPTGVSAYIMQAALRGEGCRVQLKSVENTLVEQDARQSISSIVPWFAPAERIIQARLDRGVEGLGTSLSDICSLYARETICSGPVDAMLRPAMNAYVCILAPTHLAADKPHLSREMARKFPRPYQDLANALVSGEHVYVPLWLDQSDRPAQLQWPDDPREAQFYSITDEQAEWAAKQPANAPNHHNMSGSERFKQLTLEKFSPPPLGPFEFKREAGLWKSTDGKFSLTLLCPVLIIHENKTNTQTYPHEQHTFVI